MCFRIVTLEAQDGPGRSDPRQPPPLFKTEAAAGVYLAGRESVTKCGKGSTRVSGAMACGEEHVA